MNKIIKFYYYIRDQLIKIYQQKRNLTKRKINSWDDIIDPSRPNKQYVHYIYDKELIVWNNGFQRGNIGLPTSTKFNDINPDIKSIEIIILEDKTLKNLFKLVLIVLIILIIMVII